MSDISDRYRRLASAFTERVQAVPAERWSSPSPCEGFTARQVVAHLRDGNGRLLGLIGRELPAGPSVEDDPAGSWAVARDTMQAALDDPAVARTEYESPMGSGIFEEGVDRFVNLDVLVHTWDLARATGLDERLDPAEVHRTFEAARPMDQMLRSPNVCGPKLDPPPDADEQIQLLAFLGRQAWA